MSQRDPIQDYLDINNELREYDKLHEKEDGFIPLSSRPQILALNKSDVVSEELLSELQVRFNSLGVKPMIISAATRHNLKELVYAAGSWVFKEKTHEQ
jgi:GTP-binding protein